MTRGARAGLAVFALIGFVTATIVWLVFMSEGDAFPPPKASGIHAPEDITCRSVPFVTTDCERQKASYAASYAAADDPALVGLMAQGLVAEGVRDSGAGAAAVRQYGDRFSPGADVDLLACGREAYLRAAYGVASSEHTFGAATSGFELVLAAGKLTSAQEAVVESGVGMLSEGGMVDRVRVEVHVAQLNRDLTSC